MKLISEEKMLEALKQTSAYLKVLLPTDYTMTKAQLQSDIEFIKSKREEIIQEVVNILYEQQSCVAAVDKIIALLTEEK